MYTLAIAGSTQRTVQVAETLSKDPRFKISLVLTPKPRETGRKKELTQNPLHAFSKDNKLPAVLVDTSLDADVQKQIKQHFAQTPFDFLLVVDFGYLVPKWLLDLPKIAPLNIHPSHLPRWRGASPGQFVLLSGETKSAVTLMVMNEALDEGPTIAQQLFTVDQTWTQVEYYQHAFDLICSQLGDLIEQFAKGELKAQPQPLQSPTPLADRLSKKESFRPWADVQRAMTDGTDAVELERASRAYFPWPKLWTLVPTIQGEKRLIVHRSHLESDGTLALDQVQLEGKNVTTWTDVQAAVEN